MNIRSTLSTFFSSTWTTLGGFFGLAGYSATDPRRKILPLGIRPPTATANQLLTSSLPLLRAYCRHLERNNPTARAGVEGLVANIVGTGIGLEPDTGIAELDDRVRAVWQDFISDCAANGMHDMYYLQCQALRETVIAGEFVWRLVTDPSRIDQGKIPLAVLPLEAEWLNVHANTIGHPDDQGRVWIGGVGVDKFGKPIAYQIHNPEVPGSEIETLQASELIHDFERRRALQARGEPWFAPIIEVMQQERDLVDAELKAAVNTASMSMVIESEFHDTLDTTEAQTLKIGGVARMFPGETVKAFSSQRPSQQIAPFRQMLRGDIAAALRIPQRFLDRDVSRANYSSMRADMIDSDRLLAPVREWFGHATIGRVYQAVLPYLALKAGIKTPRMKYRLVPDGQPYVDPEKDVKASMLAIVGGLSTFEKEIGKRGEDAKKQIAQLSKERKDPLLNEIFEAHLYPTGKAQAEEVAAQDGLAQPTDNQQAAGQ
jgi:lambda family phage portal protein